MIVESHNEQQNRADKTFCCCPGCGLELCNSASFYSDSDLVRYSCVQCGHKSGWLFDAPVPILVEGRVEK